MVGPTTLLSATLARTPPHGCGIGPIGHGIVRAPAQAAAATSAPADGTDASSDADEIRSRRPGMLFSKFLTIRTVYRGVGEKDSGSV